MPPSDDELIALAKKHGIEVPGMPPQISDNELLALAAKHGIAAPAGGDIQGPPAYGYYGTDDKDLNHWQRMEKELSVSGGNKMGLIQPGHEWFSPDAIEGTKRYANAVAAAPLIATGVGAPIAVGGTTVGQAAMAALPKVAHVVGKGGLEFLGFEGLKKASEKMGLLK